MVPYYSKALILRTCAQVLRLPPDCVSSALILFHKFKRSQREHPGASVSEDVMDTFCVSHE